MFDVDNSNDNKVTVLELNPSAEPAPHTRLGRIVEWTVGEPVHVDYEGNPHGPLPARSICALDAEAITAAVRDGRGVLLCFEDGRDDAPIIVGLIQPLPCVETSEPETSVMIDGLDGVDGVDGQPTPQRLQLEGRDEVVLRCGKASITLRRNGRVVIRGTYLESRSRGVNRVKGGSVEIN